jgi:hypothetical protein
MADHTDRHGRTPSARVDAVHRFGDPITPRQRTAATALLVDLLDAAARHGITLADLDAVVDLPGGCLDAIAAKERQG